MVTRKLQISILTTIIITSLSIMLVFVIKSFSTNNNLNQIVDKYDVKVENVDNEDNLSPNIVESAIDIKKLNASIVISLDKNYQTLSSQLQIVYKIQFNQDLFQYIFLKLIIKTFPQWKTNNFSFHFNILNNAVWVEYNTNQKLNYLQWYFKITNKI